MATSHALPDWLKGVQRRLQDVENERDVVAGDIARLEERAQLLSEERIHLRALLDIPRSSIQPPGSPGSRDLTSHAEVAESAPATHASEVPAGTPASRLTAAAAPPASLLDIPITSSTLIWKGAVRELLLEHGQPLHYRLIHQGLRRIGVTFGGQNPAASFLAVLNRDDDFARVGRGVYWVKDTPLPAVAAIATRRRPHQKVRKRR